MRKAVPYRWRAKGLIMKTQCPNCNSRFNVDDKFAGKLAKCPKCTKQFTIEPFIETPNIAQAPVSPAPVAPPQPPSPVHQVETPTNPPPAVAQPEQTPQPAVIPAKTVEQAKEEKPESSPVSTPRKKTGLSKIVFVYTWIIVRLIAVGLAGWGLTLSLNKGQHSILITAFATADVFLTGSIAIELLLFYKIWAAIADKQTSLTPGKAVGFLFIPVFNIYWALNMVMAIADDYNSFLERRSLKTRDLSPTLFMLYAFTFMLSIISVTIPMLCVFVFLGLMTRAFASYAQVAWLLVGLAVLAGLGHFVAYVLSATKICDAVNSLPD